MATEIDPGRRPRRIFYGDGPDHFGELWLPDASHGRRQPDGDSGAGRFPVVITVHGGFWRSPYELDLMNPMAADLIQHGLAVWNIEYRRVGQDGGGVPGTLDDVLAATNAVIGLADDHPIDPGRVSVVGHSAGGHLALWLGSWPQVAVEFDLVVGLAAVTDLYRCAADGLGQGAAQEFLGGEPAEAADAYRHAQPALGLRWPTLLVTGTEDDRVPATYTTDHRAGEGARGRIETIVVDGEDHFDVIDPGSRSWSQVRAAILGGDGA
jgi:acetyl esterase/lipase